MYRALKKWLPRKSEPDFDFSPSTPAEKRHATPVRLSDTASGESLPLYARATAVQEAAEADQALNLLFTVNADEGWRLPAKRPKAKDAPLPEPEQPARQPKPEAKSSESGLKRLLKLKPAAPPKVQLPPRPPARPATTDLPIVRKTARAAALPFQPGDHVMHAKFGIGQVTHRFAIAANKQVLLVEFPTHGKRMLDPALVSMKRIR